MALQNIEIGSGPNARDGDSLRTAFIKVNANFAELASTSLDLLAPVAFSNSYADLYNKPELHVYATFDYVDTTIANLIDAAPETLDTLNELAAAIGDNANFVTDINDAIALKADTSYVDSGLSLKANIIDVDASLVLKADTSYVDSGLSLKANIIDVDASLALKADTADLSVVALSGSYADLLNIPEDLEAKGYSTPFGTTPTVIDTFDATVYRGMKYIITFQDKYNNKYYSSEILVIHDGTTAYMTQYAIISTMILDPVVSVNLSGSTVELIITSPIGSNNVVSYQRFPTAVL